MPPLMGGGFSNSDARVTHLLSSWVQDPAAEFNRKLTTEDSVPDP